MASRPGVDGQKRLRATMVLAGGVLVGVMLVLGGCAHGGASGASGAASAPDGMVRIPAGPFTMGTDRTDEADSTAADLGLPYIWYSDAGPAQVVELPAYDIDRYEMTNAEYLQFLNATELPIDPPHSWDGRRPAEGTSDLPVAGLNWYEAYLVCQHFGKRLPTEAEWEKAARGPEGLLYPWGNTYDERRANVAQGKAGRMMPVGSFPNGVSPYGLHDMIGNAWEWTKSWYVPYPGSTYESENYGKRFKVIRGNSYAEPGHFDAAARTRVIGEMSRANYRFSFAPQGRFRDSGVRCAKSLPGTS